MSIVYQGQELSCFVQGKQAAHQKGKDALDGVLREIEQNCARDGKARFAQ